MRTTSLIITAFFCIFVFAGPGIAGGTTGTIYLTANPNAIVADGKSICTVTAQVRDANGNAVTSGEVLFSTSLGVIEEVAQITAGMARARLISSNIKGTAIVTATCVADQAVSQIKVDFGDSTVISTGPQYIKVNAEKYLAYSMDYKVLDAVGHVKIRYRSLDMEASEAQIDLDHNRIVAKGDGTQLIRIPTTTGVVTGNMFFCNMGARGVLLSADTGQAREIDISHGKPVVVGKTVGYSPQDFAFRDLSDSLGLLKAGSAIIFPNEKIQFTKASLYVDGKCRFSLPLYVLSLNGYQVDGKPYIDYSTNGILLNLPLYYSLSPSSTGAFLITHGANPGWGSLGQVPGWGLDLRQQYKTDSAQGSLEFSQITSAMWGAHFQHTQQLDPLTHSYLYMDYTAQSGLFGSFNVDHSFDAFNLGLNLSESSLVSGENTLTGNLYAQTKPKPLGNSIFKYTFSGSLAYSSPQTTIVTTNPTTTTPTTPIPTALTTTVPTGVGLAPSVLGNVYSTPYKLTKTLSLTESVSLGYIWGTEPNSTGVSSIATSALDWKISPRSGLQLGYRYADRPSVYTDLLGGKQSMTAMWHYNGNRLSASLFAIQGLDYSSLNFFSDLSYKVTPLWRVGTRSTLNRYPGTPTLPGLEFAIGRKLGSRELDLVWSQSDHRILCEFLGSSF